MNTNDSHVCLAARPICTGRTYGERRSLGHEGCWRRHGGVCLTLSDRSRVRPRGIAEAIEMRDLVTGPPRGRSVSTEGPADRDYAARLHAERQPERTTSRRCAPQRQCGEGRTKPLGPEREQEVLGRGMDRSVERGRHEREHGREPSQHRATQAGDHEHRYGVLARRARGIGGRRRCRPDRCSADVGRVA
jgi:hypothetical protein